MGEMDPVRPPSSAGLRVALAILAVALVGAGAYIVHLRSRLNERRTVAAPAPRVAAQAPAEPAAGASGQVLTAAQQRAMVSALKSETGSGRKAVFHVQQNNPDTGAVQVALQQIFEQAGWPTETIRTSYPLKSGIFLLAADEEPPDFVDTVDGAFKAAGIEVQYLTGYRSFFVERKQQNPNWYGPELTDDQPFTIVIGSKPGAAAAKTP